MLQKPSHSAAYSALDHQLSFLVVFQAVCRNNVNTVKCLLECGADLNVRDLYGLTPLKNAEIFENKEMIELLQSAMEKKTEAKHE